MAKFTAEVFQNPYLADGATEAQAVVEVTCTEAGAAGAGGAIAGEIIIVDNSGSMGGEKIAAACTAAAAAIAEIPDGTLFAVVGGADVPRLVYGGRDWALVPMDKTTRRSAIEAARNMDATGGTAIGSWLTAAARMFEHSPATQRHALLMTDGLDQGETPQELEKAIKTAAKVFQCDCRGVGTDWNVAEVRKIAEALMGTVALIAKPSDMAEDFRAIMKTAASRGVASARLRIWVPAGAKVLFVRQVAPTLEELTARGVPVSELITDYDTGAWGDETREFHFGVQVAAQPLGTERLVARPQVMIGDEVAASGLVRALWSDDASLTAKIEPAVAHYTGQTELAAAIQEGLAAREAGDEATATIRLGDAVRLAAETGNDEATIKLGKVVDVDDSGTVRLKASASKLDAMDLDTASTKTSRVKR